MVCAGKTVTIFFWGWFSWCLIPAGTTEIWHRVQHLRKNMVTVHSSQTNMTRGAPISDRLRPAPAGAGSKMGGTFPLRCEIGMVPPPLFGKICSQTTATLRYAPLTLRLTAPVNGLRSNGLRSNGSSGPRGAPRPTLGSTSANAGEAYLGKPRGGGL